MGYLRIHCARCRRRWDIYSRDNWNGATSHQCPHCGAAMDRQTWERQILPAFGAIEDANKEIYKDHVGYKIPMFRIDFIADKAN